MIRTLFYTLYTALFSTLIACVIGVSAAFFTARRSFVGRRFLLAAGIVPLCVPSLVIALGYVSFFGVNGIASGWLKSLLRLTGRNFGGLPFLYTTAGVVIAQGFYNFPLVTRIVNDAWERLPRDNENAARLLGAGEGRVFFTVTLPRLSGAIGAACIPVFLFCFFSFMIVLLFSPPGTSTLEVELYHSVRTTLDLQAGTKLAVVETVCALWIVFLYSYVIRKNQSGVEGLSFTSIKKCRIGKSDFCPHPRAVLEVIFFIILITLILLFFTGPGLGVLVSAFTQKKQNVETASFIQFKTLFATTNFWKSLGYSVVVGLCTASMCCLIAFVYSVVIRMKRRQNVIALQMIPLLPMTISSVVVGWILGLIFGGSVLSLIICQTLLYWPVAYKQIQNGLNQLTDDTQNAAFVISRGSIDCALRFYLPSCRSVMFTAFSYCFAMSIGDATLPLVLAIPNFSTLALYTYRLAGAFRFNQACACALVIILVAALPFIRRNK